LPTCITTHANLCARYISTGDEEDVSEEDEEEEEQDDDDEEEEEGDEEEEAEANGVEGKSIHLCEHGKTKARVCLASRVAPAMPMIWGTDFARLPGEQPPVKKRKTGETSTEKAANGDGATKSSNGEEAEEAVKEDEEDEDAEETAKVSAPAKEAVKAAADKDKEAAGEGEAEAKAVAANGDEA
jgi:hypothetical protein